MKLPMDQQARDRFATELDRNFCVCAGAGVGKTTAIVKRVAQIAMSDESELSRLVVVTYGRAAAEELLVRSRDMILTQMRRSAHRRQNLLSELQRAFFGTIHGFCLKLVQDQGRFLGLPQSLQLVEGDDEKALWRRFCESRALESLKLPEDHLRSALRFLSFEDLLNIAAEMSVAMAEKARPAMPDATAPGLDLEAALADSGGKSKEQTAKNQEHLRKWLREYEGDSSFLKIPAYDKGSGTFKAAFNAGIALLREWLSALAAALAAEIALAYRDYRLEQGRVTYDDQIRWCRALLENPVVLKRLRSRHYVVILDEAQDTDSDMFAILTELTRPQGASVATWPSKKQAPAPEPGRFCFVGDDQQSIYGGRADPQTYRSYIDAFKAGNGGELLELSVTMRCPAQVVAAVNSVFVSRGRLKQTYVEFRELHPRPGSSKGAVWHLPIGAGPEEEGVDAQFAWECRQAGHFIRERGREGLGVSRWSDVAILCPRNRWLSAAAEVFKELKIPHRLVSAKRLELEFARRSWPAALLHVVLNPWDRFERVGVLREIFAVSDVDLAEEHLKNERSPRLQKAAELLDRLTAAVPRDGGQALSRFVEFMLEETQLAARLSAIGEPTDALDFFRHASLRAECDGLSLRDWSAAACRQLQQEAHGIVESGDEIQLLTCWKAKGLEWPVVIALGLGRQIRSESAPYPRVLQGPRGVDVHFSAAMLDDQRKDQEELRQREELQRVLYVTFTRARSLLVVPDSTALYKKAAPNFFELSRWSELKKTEFLERPAKSAPAGETHPHVEPSRHSPPEHGVIEEAAERSERIPRRILPHELAHDRSVEPPDREPLTGVGGLDYGSWWHRTMESFPWMRDSAARARYVSEAAAQAVRIPVVGERGSGELRKFVEGTFHKQLLEAGEIFLPEMPFSHPRSANEWMEGVIDLAVLTRSGEVWILDWKTDRMVVGEGEAEFQKRLRDSYRPQLDAYAEMMRDGVQRPVTRLLLYSTELGVAIG
jgi:ATP-dependent exoDNAse (exonuclease V) beta subunit